MKVQTDSDRVRHSRKLVLELLASSVDLSTTAVAPDYLERYAAQPERFGPPAPPDPGRDRKRTGHHVEPDGETAATVHAPIKIDNELYVRDYSKCILCYKCVDACGEQYQNTFAIHVAGRGFDARISTEYVAELPESACVYCGNCIAVCPTGALMFRSEHELREDGDWREDEQTVTQTICPYCGSAATSSSTCRTTRSSRCRAPMTTTSRAATSASRGVSASSTSRRATRAESPFQMTPCCRRNVLRGALLRPRSPRYV